MYCAVIGDIIGSRKIADRGGVQKKLNEILAEINEKYRDSIESPFMITLGDEFQGLLKNGEHALEIAFYIDMNIYPVRIRYGIGTGDISTEIDAFSSLGADGEAYWNAREAINTVHRNSNYGMSRTYVITSTGKEYAGLINGTLRLCDMTEEKWTESQREFICEFMPYFEKGMPQKAIAEKMNISCQSVNSKIKNTGIQALTDARKSVSELLKKM